jgi:hypothetical protein
MYDPKIGVRITELGWLSDGRLVPPPADDSEDGERAGARGAFGFAIMNAAFELM